jgi:hypothetical protein
MEVIDQTQNTTTHNTMRTARGRKVRENLTRNRGEGTVQMGRRDE